MPLKHFHIFPGYDISVIFVILLMD